MHDNHAQPIIDEVIKTPNTPEGMKHIVDMSIKGISKIDEGLLELQTQRETLAKILSQYNDLYKVVQGEALESEKEIEQIVGQGKDTLSSSEISDLILKIAKEKNRKGLITDKEIIKAIGARITWRWSNYKAVIGTILHRSGIWKKKEPGVYVQKEPSEK